MNAIQLERFMAKINRMGSTPQHAPYLGACWEWRAARDPHGYGRVDRKIAGTSLAHRVGYLHFIGPIPEDLTLDHLCANTSCVNPFHLQAVTHAEQMRRAKALNRFKPTRWNANLTECRQGHPLEGDNVRLDPRGSRHCCTCDDLHRLARSERRRLARITKYGYDPGPRARFDPATAARA